MFSLRLRGHLLYGLCRIYYKKVEFLYADCTKVLVKIKNVRSLPYTASLAMGVPRKSSIQAPQQALLENDRWPPQKMLSCGLNSMHLS